MRSTYTHPLPIKLIAIVAAVAVLVVGVLIYVFNSFARVEPGFVGLVRNGGPFDNRNFQKVITPADGVTNVGMFSTVSEYPTTDRYDYVQPGEYGARPEDGDDLQTDRYRTRTKDGLDVGVQGQWRYVVNTDPAVLEQFDAKFGTRSYSVPGSPDERVRVSDGDRGMAVFIAGQLRPIQQEALRAGIGSANGEELDPSFALLRNLSADPNTLANATPPTTDNAAKFAQLSDSISGAFVNRLNEQLGTAIVDGKPQPFLIAPRFTLQQVYPSPDTQSRIQDVRTAVANLAKANADAAANVAAANGEAQRTAAEAEGRRLVAEKEAQAQVLRQQGYAACTTCADMDKIRAQGEAQAAANAGWKTAPQIYAPGSDAGFLQAPR
jgi:hypothetical protein